MRHPAQPLRARAAALPEAVAVALIVAALAGVAFPLYTGYVDSVRANAARRLEADPAAGRRKHPRVHRRGMRAAPARAVAGRAETGPLRPGIGRAGS